MKKVIYLFIIFYFSSCVNSGTEKNLYYGKKENKCEIHRVLKKDIPIGDSISVLTNYIQYVKEDDLLLFYNQYDNSIYAFNYEQGTLNKSIQLRKEGNNGVGEIQGFSYVNRDSIFVYNYEMFTLFLVNSSATVLWKKRLPMDEISEKGFLPAYPWLQTNCLMVYWNNKLILGGFGATESEKESSSNLPVTTIYEFQKDTVLLANNYPSQYQQYNWGGAFFRMPYFDVNKDNGTILVSFPQDHNLYVYSLYEFIQKKYYAGCNQIKQINAYDQKKGEIIDQERAYKWYLNTPSYRNIHYDPYRKLYYRLACLPANETLKKKYTIGIRPIILIVMDEYLRYLGECVLPDNIELRYTNSFVTKDGLNIQVLTDNEDLMTFYQFEVNIHE